LGGDKARPRPVLRGGFDEGGAGFDRAGALAGFDHRSADAVFDRAAGG